jgi:hypothetical protein
VTGGIWLDPYTGATVRDPGDIQIDHIVPLAGAWRSGAWEWSTDARARFANDPLEIVVSGGSANQSKSDDGPHQWRPPEAGSWCLYATRWIAIKQKYALTLESSAEREALGQMLETCPLGAEPAPTVTVTMPG